MKPTAEDVLKAHELLEGAERDKMFGHVDVAYRVASFIAEQRAGVPAWLREHAARSNVSKYDAHVLEEAASVLEGETANK